MDKYAVDLDQVLNDFEYSELTDQYSNAPRTAAATSSSPSQNNITKHSINNVFHSLNEYLNTNIKNVTPLNPLDNKPMLLENKENYAGEVNTIKLSQNNYKEEEKSIKDCISKTDFKEQILVDTSISGSEIELDEKKDSVVSNNEVVEEVAGNDIEKEGVLVEERTDKTKVFINGNCEGYDSKEIAADEKDAISENAAEPVTEEASEIECISVSASDGNREEADGKIEEGTVEIVGFSDDLELDENEVNKLLEDLEEEDLGVTDELKSHAIDLPESVTTEIEICENDTEINGTKADGMQNEEVASVSLSTNAIELPIEEIVTENEEISEDKNDVPSQNDKDTETKTQILDFTENVALQSEEKAEIEEPVSKPLQVDEAEPELPVKQEVIEETGSVEQHRGECSRDAEEESVLVEAELPEIEKEDSADSLSRPQNLPLNGEGDQPKRKIDLIGDPGSTPYNNVYINKEIPRNKEKPYDSDTDYSTSSSPTFSDASSTTSTVSADEMHNENKKYAETNPDGYSNQELKDIQDVQCSPAAAVGEAETLRVDQDPTSDVINPTSDVINPTSDESATSDLDTTAPDDLFVPGTAPQQAASGSSDENATGVEGASAISSANVENVDENALSMEKQWLGKEAPHWVPDSDATSCLHCDMRFTVLKRRHHCRACGLVLCSKCCHLRFRLEYLDAEARVCNKCHDILNKDTNSNSSADASPEAGNSPSHRPNPNNPLEYCSTVSPLQQVAGANPNPPAVMVPVGVLKRKGSNKAKSNKSVMFCDGIRPGSDLTSLDNDFDYNKTKTKKLEKANAPPAKPKRNLPVVDPETNTFIPSSENCLPPTVVVSKTDISYADCENNPATVEILKNDQLTFALQLNLHVHVKIVDMSCCINKKAWCFSTEGLINVGQDEVVILLEYIDEESFVPKDVFYHINSVHNDAVKGTSVKEMGLSLHNTSNFLDSKNHAGFVYIRPTFQCLENVIKPKEPYLIGILIHRWETPWAKLFPLRLVLRLGAEYRYYPSPIISTRHRDSVFVEIGHTIINLLADFRNFSYTLPQIRGLTIHMEEKNTTITIPVNRYDQVMKSMNNSSDHILAFAGNFSQQADSHLVCIQDTQGNDNCYSTHAINIHNKPRKITGASFIVFNGALKSSSGLTAKSNIVEDGLMIQVLPEHMQQIRDNLRAMKGHTIPCGCVNAATDETVNIVWGENDVNFNIGVASAIDDTPLGGVPSIRVHNAKNHICANGSRVIRWTEVFIIQNGEDSPKNQDSVDISRVSENIAKATCDALVKYLDLLVANNCQKIGIRTTLHVDNVSYLAGSNGTKLPPIYMKSLDNELIPVLHRITSNNLGEHSIVLELIFRILNL